MDIGKELELFKRYYSIFSVDNNAIHAITAVHLAQQLQRYIDCNLDLGWIIRCILDLNSNNSFTAARGEEFSVDNSVHPEYKYAVFLSKLCKLIITVTSDKSLTREELSEFYLGEGAHFYYGESLVTVYEETLKLATSKAILEEEPN